MSCQCQDRHCSKKEKSIGLEKILYILAVLIFFSTFILNISEFYIKILYGIVILLAGYEIIFSGLKNIFKFNFKEDTLMTIAIIAACLLGEFIEGCLVVLLFKLGEFIEERAVDKSNESINNIVDIKAKNANFLGDNDEIKVVDVNELKIGDKILIKPGEMVPVDCKVLSGNSTIDTSNITGESEPVFVTEGTELLSGSINLNGSVTCVVSKLFQDSTASQIVDLVYEAQNNKGRAETFITKFSKIYTPTVIVIAVFIALIPVLLGFDFKTWIMRALVFLVASCPCSIIISVPLTLYTCLGRISKKGMLMKGTKHIENLAKAKIVAFDKTGTITTGKMEIDEIKIFSNEQKEETLNDIYQLERLSNHPISTAIVTQIEQMGKKEKKQVDQYEEIPGLGICGYIQGKEIIFGNEKLLEKKNVFYPDRIENVNYICIDKKVVGYMTFKEKLRENVEQLMQNLKKIGINETVMLTGDNDKNAKEVAQKIGIDAYYAKLLPNQKLEKIEELKEKGKTIFIGDGINDSPVLASADFSISIGEGTEIANNTADSILISNRLESITSIIKSAKQAMRILTFNLSFSLLAKIVVFILGIIGVAPVWLAVLADVGVTIITVLNAIRIS